MARIKKIKRFRYYLTSPVTLLFLLAVIGLTARAVWGLYQKNLVAAGERAAAAAELVRLEARAAELESAIAGWATERGREATLRENLPVARPGEQVLQILDPIVRE